ncbi:MAG: cupin domain-containing protein [Planctomycetota bacterium]
MTAPQSVIALTGLRLPLEDGDQPTGPEVLRAMLSLAEATLGQLAGQANGSVAALGRLRGTGRGVSFGRIIERLERDQPLELVSPFEGSERVAGAVWPHPDGGDLRPALAKLRWSAGADDLPMHAHEHSGRFIVVHEGRGYFHVSRQPLGRFDGTDVRTVPARERDVFVFTPGVVHTFSTARSPMTLLSCQAPFLEFDNPRQYTLPAHHWSARTTSADRAAIACDAAWTCLTAAG